MTTDQDADSYDFEHRFSMVLGAAEQAIGRRRNLLGNRVLLASQHLPLEPITL